MHLAITPTRLALLADIARTRIARIGQADINLRTETQVTGAMRDLGLGGWAYLEDRVWTVVDPTTMGAHERQYWQLTPLGRGYAAVQIVDLGDRVQAQTGPQDNPTVIGELRSLSGLPGRHRITIGATTLVVELRHQAARAVAAMELATAALTPDDPSLPDGA